MRDATQAYNKVQEILTLIRSSKTQAEVNSRLGGEQLDLAKLFRDYKRLPHG